MIKVLWSSYGFDRTSVMHVSILCHQCLSPYYRSTCSQKLSSKFRGVHLCCARFLTYSHSLSFFSVQVDFLIIHSSPYPICLQCIHLSFIPLHWKVLGLTEMFLIFCRWQKECAGNFAHTSRRLFAELQNCVHQNWSGGKPLNFHLGRGK